jgi:hypothetical protein
LHHAQRGQASGPELIASPVAFQDSRELLNLVADLGVTGQVSWLNPTLTQLFCGFEFGSIVFRLLPLIHQLRSGKGDLTTKFARHFPAPYCSAA